MTTSLRRSCLALSFALALLPVAARAQDAHDAPPLSAEIARMDSLAFDVAFNECDLDVFLDVLDDDFEFYDDRSGLNTSLDAEVRSFRDRCSKEQTVTRKLLDDRVYPLGDYGAVQVGEHEFSVGGVPVERSRFTHVWRRSETGWTIARILSYDHRPIEEGGEPAP